MVHILNLAREVLLVEQLHSKKVLVRLSNLLLFKNLGTCVPHVRTHAYAYVRRTHACVPTCECLLKQVRKHEIVETHVVRMRTHAYAHNTVSLSLLFRLP